MAALPEAFDPSTVSTSNGGDYKPYEAGDYLAHIVESRYEANADNTYAAIKLKCVILSGPKADKPFFVDITRRTASNQAQAIGDHQLALLLAAVGHTGILKDTDDLHHKPAIWTLTIEAERPNPKGGVYAARNKLAAYNGIKAPGAGTASKPPLKKPDPITPKPQAEAKVEAPQAAQEPAASGAADELPDWAK